MKEEYDFENAEQGKFYRPLEELDIPIYLDREVREFFLQNFNHSDSNPSLHNIAVSRHGDVGVDFNPRLRKLFPIMSDR